MSSCLKALKDSRPDKVIHFYPAGNRYHLIARAIMDRLRDNGSFVIMEGQRVNGSFAIMEGQRVNGSSAIMDRQTDNDSLSDNGTRELFYHVVIKPGNS